MSLDFAETPAPDHRGVRSRTRWKSRLLTCALAAASAAACGKKGPPLAPVVRIPAAIETVETRRVGNDVFVTVTVPAANIDESIPADIARIDIYAYTGRTAPPRPRFPELASVVASVPVAPAPRAPADGGTPPPGDPALGVLQGAQVTVRDSLTADELVQGPLLTATPREAETARRRAEEDADPSAAAKEAALAAQPLRRFYVAIPFSPRGRPGPWGAPAELVLGSPIDPPSNLRVTYAETDVTIAWDPAGGLIGFLLDQALPPEPSPLDDGAPGGVLPTAGASVVPVPAGPTRYNVYRELAPDPLEPPTTTPASRWNVSPPTPLNAAPLAALTFFDALEFNRERCYAVRAVRGTAPALVESDVAGPKCVTPIDTFPPAPPQALAAVAAEGAISLIWEAGIEADLGGYIVLRGEAAGGTLQPLNALPLLEPRFRDASVTPGVRYVYAVVAVDNRVPVPNVSAESNRVEETAR